MDNTTALKVDQVSKSFGSTKALDNVSLSVNLGEIHALLGHNGSGKSTLIKIISGYHKPDDGKVFVNGHEIHYPTSALKLRDYGVSFMHQDIGLVPSLSILENLRIGRFETGGMRHIRWRKEIATVRELIGNFGLDLNPELPVSRLSSSQRAILGLVRAFQDVQRTDKGLEGGLIILDEPTAALPEAEKELLFGAIKMVADKNVGVLIVTHHLEEPLRHADKVSVLRDGALVASDQLTNHSYESLAELVVGHSIETTDRRKSPNCTRSDLAIEVKGISGGTVRDASFDAYKGEIIGLSGLMGSGHEELPFLIYGASDCPSGEILIEGHKFSPDPINARKYGLAFVSGDRLRAGGVLSASIGENVSLPMLKDMVGKFGWLRYQEEESLVQQMIAKFKIRMASPHAPFSVLSGGNQQKALIGRWIASKPKILLLQEPTAGVDIGASMEIIAMLQEFAMAGGTVIFSSEQYEDVASLSDRVLVFRGGRIAAQLSGPELTSENIVDASYGKLEVGRVDFR